MTRSCGRRSRFALLGLATAVGWSQLTTGTLEIQAPAGTEIDIRGRPGSVIEVRADTGGESTLVLPYGTYQVTGAGSTAGIYVPPLSLTRVVLSVEQSRIRSPEPPLPPSLHGLLLTLDPAIITQPLDFTGLGSIRLPLISTAGLSWTETRYTLDGMNATDAWQPGRAGILPDVQALAEVAVRGPEIALFLPEAGRGWHGELSSVGDGPPGTARPLAERYNWFSRDNLQAGGAAGRRVDLFFSGTGQWASQVEPQAAGPDLRSRALYGNARGRVAVTDRDQVEAHFSGSQVHLSNWGVPAGLEALLGRRMSPEFDLPWGFAGLEENDHLDSVQVGWTRQFAGAARSGALQVRFSFAPMHLDTLSRIVGQSRIELLGSAVTEVPPLTNLAARTRHELQAAYEPGALAWRGMRHRIAIGGGWDLAKTRNRFGGGQEVITVDGVPAFVVNLNTPTDSHTHVRTPSVYLRDHISYGWLALDAGLEGDFPRGSLPGRADLIAWSSAAPRVALAIAPPMFRRLVLRGGYARIYAPLAGRYLDFGDPGSLGGSEYQALADGRPGPLLLRFGGPYSAIAPGLRRPYWDEFTSGAEVRLPAHAFAAVRLFRRDQKDRLAAIDTGVPPSAYRAVRIIDPGPDFIPGTFDDQAFTVYAQDPASFGKDQYLLTNPGLRELNEGVVAEAGGQWGAVVAHASFMTMKAWGPANPGNSPLENDPGVIGALLADPNTTINATGHAYFDRAFAGKVQLSARLPQRWGGLEIANTANYFDGLVFARQLLVTGLPQGPFLVGATLRGSPEGGNRSEFVIDWNLRVSRSFSLPYGSLRLALDVFNVTNANNRLQESDLSGPAFNQRLPVEIEPPRLLRFEARYRF